MQKFWSTGAEIKKTAGRFSKSPLPSVETLCVRAIQGEPKKPDHFLNCMTPIYDEIGRRSIYKAAVLFIRSKTNIQNVAIFKYS